MNKLIYLGVEHSLKKGDLINLTKFLETPKTKLKNNKQTLGAKVKSRKGNSPDHILRF